jgi:hypothetical protein
MGHLDALTAFDDTLARWHDFYLLAGTAAATLIGLLFVAVSLNPAIVAEEDQSGLRLVAIQAFSNFVYLLAIALVFLIPDQSPRGFGIALVCIGAFAVATPLARTIQARRASTNRRRGGHTRVLSAIVAYLIIIAVGVSQIAVEGDATAWLVMAAFFLLRSAAASAWELLLHISDHVSRTGPASGSAGSESTPLQPPQPAERDRQQGARLQ